LEQCIRAACPRITLPRIANCAAIEVRGDTGQRCIERSKRFARALGERAFTGARRRRAAGKKVEDSAGARLRARHLPARLERGVDTRLAARVERLPRARIELQLQL